MKVALLARVSTQEQAMHGHSIGEQVERMKDYCKAMGWTIYKEYVDAGYSGATTDRPALQRMLRDIRAGKIDKVLVYKLDRLSRSQKDTLELIEDEFLKNNTDFVSMSENFDTSTPFGRAMIGILAVFAQLEREQIKERMMMGKVARAKKGKFSGSAHSPYGYVYEDGMLKINDFEKMLVIKIFEDYVGGTAPFTIANKLNEAGYPTRNKVSWSDQVVRQILKNKTYIGYIHYQNQWYEGSHDKIISDDLFYKAQEMREKNREKYLKFNQRVGKANSYLGGLLVCANCGAKLNKALTGKIENGKDYRKPFYVCQSRSKRRKEMVKDPNCKNKRWHMEELDNLVFCEIRKLKLDPEYLIKITETNADNDKIDTIKNEIKKLDTRLERMMDLYEEGEIPKDVLQDRIHKINDQKSLFENEISIIHQEQKKKLSLEKTACLVDSFDEVLNQGDFDEIRNVITTLINYIEIDNEIVTIHWNFI